MSFLKHKTVIEEGDTVILYLSANKLHAIEVSATIVNKKNETIDYVFQTNFGAIKIKDLIGVQYGSKVQLSKGWAYVLQANPELWTKTLPHRTQIIYTPDISMILFELEIRPGNVIIESGTGSGSLSHYFIRAIKPFGHLHTFDFHELRAEQAKTEFINHGIGDFVTVYHRDVCELGFTDELDGKADAVFLDLPAPEKAVPHAFKSLKSTGGRFCSFSPCIEQTHRCCEALQALGFVEIKTIEILQVEETVKVKSIPIMDLEFVKHKKIENPDDSNGGIAAETKNPLQSKTPKEFKKVLTSFGPQQTAGHTGYLTFATLLPLCTR